MINVKVGSLEVVMDIEFQRDARANIPYIGKVLGLPPGTLQSQQAGFQYDLREKDAVNSLPANASLKGAGIQEAHPAAGERTEMDPLSNARTIELFDPNNPELEPAYPNDRFGIPTLPVAELPLEPVDEES